MGLRCNGSSRSFFDRIASDLYDEKPKSTPSEDRSRRCSGSEEGFSRAFEEYGSSRKPLNSSSQSYSKSSQSSSYSNSSKASSSSYSKASESKPSNAYCRIADEISGKKKEAGKSSGGCGWHSGISDNISGDKRVSISKRLSWMETAFKKNEPSGEKIELAGNITKSFERLGTMILPLEVQCEIDKMFSEFKKLQKHI